MFNPPHADYLPSVQSDEFLPPESRAMTLSELGLVSRFGIAIALALVTKYNVTVKTWATVCLLGEIRIVQSAAEETVEQIYIEENQVSTSSGRFPIAPTSSISTHEGGF
jgi:hypothetical protein